MKPGKILLLVLLLPSDAWAAVITSAACGPTLICDTERMYGASYTEARRLREEERESGEAYRERAGAERKFADQLGQDERQLRDQLQPYEERGSPGAAQLESMRRERERLLDRPYCTREFCEASKLGGLRTWRDFTNGKAQALREHLLKAAEASSAKAAQYFESAAGSGRAAEEFSGRAGQAGQRRLGMSSQGAAPVARQGAGTSAGGDPSAAARGVARTGPGAVTEGKLRLSQDNGGAAASGNRSQLSSRPPASLDSAGGAAGAKAPREAAKGLRDAAAKALRDAAGSPESQLLKELETARRDFAQRAKEKWNVLQALLEDEEKRSAVPDAAKASGSAEAAAERPEQEESLFQIGHKCLVRQQRRGNISTLPPHGGAFPGDGPGDESAPSQIELVGLVDRR